MKKMLTVAGVSVMALSLGTGVVSATSGGGINETGPNSDNRVKVERDLRYRVENDNRVRVNNNSDQNAHSGEALVRFNTRAGDARTGDALNDNLTRTSASVDNRTSGQWGGGNNGGGDFDGAIELTGPNSDNEVKYENDVNVHFQNNNNVEVDNNSNQNATSGDATVRYNTRGGSAHTGDATNVNTTSTRVEIKN